MRTILLAFFLAASLPQDSAPATDKQADAAYNKFKKDIASNLPSAQIQAVQDLAKTRHEKIIRALSRYLLWPNDEGAAQVALALGTLDHPLSVEALLRALRPPMIKRSVVAAAMIDSLGKLGYEVAAAPLNKLINRAGDPDTHKLLPEIFKAVGRIGSASSVLPLIGYLRAFAAPRGYGNSGAEEKELVDACNNALKAITGGKEEAAQAWESWWRGSKDQLLAGAIETHRCRISWKRYECPVSQKKPACAAAGDKEHEHCLEMLRMRLIPEPKEEDDKKDKDKEEDKKEDKKD